MRVSPWPLRKSLAPSSGAGSIPAEIYEFSLKGASNISAMASVERGPFSAS